MTLAGHPTATRAPAVHRLTATAADFVLRVAPTGQLLAASSSVQDVLGWDLERCASEGMCAVIDDEAQVVAVRQLLAQALATGTARATLQAWGGPHPLWVDVAVRRLDDEPGRPLHVVARDVTDDLAAATQLAASELQWRVAFEHSPIGGALLDVDGGVLVVNEALCRMLGRREHELTRLDVTGIVSTAGGLPWDSWWHDLLDGGQQTQTTDRLLRTADGRQLLGRLTAAAVSPAGSPPRVVLQVEDITERREAELELANRALHDGLTGVPNRFLTRQWLASALEDRPDASVGVLFCDLDRFKVVNDSLGHAAGDSLLQQLAERLRGPLRPEDLLGRVGGDEFVVVLERVSTPDELAAVAARLADALDEPFDVAGHRHAMTLSMGGALGSSPDTADDVLVRADMALLRAKRLGRARYAAFDPALDRASTRQDLQLEDELRMSLGSDELRAYY